MLDIHTQHTQHGADVLHDSDFLFQGAFDDSSFCRGPQCLRPISPSFTRKTSISTSSRPTAPISPAYMESEDSAVLGDDDEFSEDELPPSPRRRHSGAMSISSEDLPFCYDREALMRDTAAHRERHRQQMQALKAKCHTGTFATEVDGPHMALWVPETGSDSNSKRTRVDRDQSASMPARSVRARKESNLELVQHVSDINGPMMTLWGL